MTKKKYIFITGTSESGKSRAAVYMEEKFPEICHLKMRDIIKKQNFKDDTKVEFWKEYLDIVNKETKNHPVVVMDTLRKPESAILIHQIVNKALKILYIDANIKKRILREYVKLEQEGKPLSIQEIVERTNKKDDEKVASGLLQIKDLCLDENGHLVKQKKGIPFVKKIQNDFSIEQFYKQLDEYIYQFVLEKEEREGER